MTLHIGPSGAELAARRKAKGWTQRQLAEAAGVGRTAVQYWEAAPHLDPRGWATQRMAEALGWHLAGFPATTRTGWGDTRHDTRGGDGLLGPLPAEIRARTGMGCYRLTPHWTHGPRRSLPPSMNARLPAPPAAASSAGPRPARARPAGTRASRAAGGASFTAECPQGRERPKESSAIARPSAGGGHRTSQLRR